MAAPLPESQKRFALRLYLDGSTTEEACAAAGVSKGTLFNFMKTTGISARPQAEVKRKYAVDDAFFDDIDTPKKAWVLGFITADGCVSDCRNAIQVGLARKDRDALEKIASAMGYSGPIHDLSSGGRDRYPQSRLSICCKRLADAIKRLGVTPRKSLTATPWFGPDRLMQHYFRGLVDGDGWVVQETAGNGGDRWEVGLVGSRDVVQAFADFVASRIEFQTKSSVRPMGKVWYVNYGGTVLPQQVASLLYSDAPVSLDRKQQLANRLIGIKFPPHYRWSFLTADQLDGLKEKHGTWDAVAKSLGIDPPVLVSNRKRLGMEMEEYRWSHLTKESLEALLKEHGTWAAVARHLGTTESIVWSFKKRLGIANFKNSWSHLTTQDASRLIDQHKNWGRVANHLGIDKSTLLVLRRRWGMSIRPIRDFSGVSTEEFLTMKKRLGTWKAVADELGTTAKNLYNVIYRRRSCSK